MYYSAQEVNVPVEITNESGLCNSGTDFMIKNKLLKRVKIAVIALTLISKTFLLVLAVSSEECGPKKMPEYFKSYKNFLLNLSPISF